MTTKFEHKNVSVCTDPVMGSRVPDYIVDRLKESVAEAVEDHLIECNHCKERYLLVLREAAIRGKEFAASNGHLAHAEEIARALELEEVPNS